MTKTDKYKLELEIINVGNGTNKYPGNFTKKENKIITNNIKGNTIHLFSGISTIGHIRVDYSCKEATHNIDVFDFLEDTIGLNYFCSVIIDFPYNQKFANKYQKIGNTPKQFIGFASTEKTTKLFNIITRIIKPEIIIMKSWNYYIPKGYYLKKGFLCYPGGYRKSTLLLIMELIE